MQNSEEKELQIEVYDQTTKSNRQLSLIPTRNWPGDGLLGIVIRLESYESYKEKDKQVANEPVR